MIERTNSSKLPIAVGLLNAWSRDGTDSWMEFKCCCGVEISKDLEKISAAKLFASGSATTKVVFDVNVGSGHDGR